MPGEMPVRKAPIIVLASLSREEGAGAEQVTPVGRPVELTTHFVEDRLGRLGAVLPRTLVECGLLLKGHWGSQQ